MIALALSPTAKAASERSLIRAHGSLFYGYNVWVVLALLNSGCSGFLVGAAFKHIDNVAVIVADVLATLLTAALSAAFFGARLTAALAGGAALIFCGLYLYYVRAEADDAAAAAAAAADAAASAASART